MNPYLFTNKINLKSVTFGSNNGEYYIDQYEDFTHNLPLIIKFDNILSFFKYSLKHFFQNIARINDDYLEKILNENCIHRIRGGYNKNRCFICAENKRRIAEIKQKQQELLLQQKRNEKIIELANRIKLQEQTRIDQEDQGRIESVLSLTPYEFETFIGNLYKKMGYSVSQTKASNDEGRDLILKKDNKKYLVECKKYQEGNNVGRPAMQKFYAAIEHDKAEWGIIVTTSDFADSVKLHRFVKNGKIKLVNKSLLLQMIKEHFPQEENLNFKNVCLECGEIIIQKFEHNGTCSNGHNLPIQNKTDYIQDFTKNQNKYCPNCFKILKVIKFKGTKFIGCSGYPNCKYNRKYKKGILTP